MIYREEDIPIYIKHSQDLLLIGVNHTKINKRKNKRKIELFKEELDSLDHLAFEGSEMIHKANPEKLTYEQIALSHFKGQKYFLDEDSDYSRILDRYGISADLFGLFKAIYGLSSVISQGLLHDFTRNMREYLEWGKQNYPGYNHVCIDKIMQFLQELSTVLESDPRPDHLIEVCNEGANKFNFYLSRLRDKEIYLPKIRKILSDFKGNKGALLGANHITRLEKLLNNEISPDFYEWKEYVQQLDKKSRRGIKFLEELVKKFE